MTTPKAPLLDVAGKSTKDVSLEAAVFGAELKPHLVHEAVRAEMNERRQGTRGAKSRGFVSGGRSKPWRQKGTGRARQGTIRAPQFTGGGVTFAIGPRDFGLKMNRTAARAALRAALSDHVQGGTFALVAGEAFTEPATRRAVEFLATWGKRTPTVVVVNDDEDNLIKSFRNLDRVIVVLPTELEVAEVVWARSLLVSEAALPLLQGRAS
jgi:large subunit ribosomal protein L4